ncbi:MAG: hypothetical protein AB8G15_00040 [Saprospiraceae bacterium]
MKKYILLFLGLILALLSPNFVAAQGAIDGFMKGKGNLDLALSFATESSGKFFSRVDGRDTTFDFGISANSVSLFAAYGITDDLDVIASIPFVSRSANTQGLQDGSVYLKYQSINTALSDLGRLKVITGAGISFPLSDYEVQNSRAIGQQALVVPLRVVAQVDLNSGLFFNITGGYNFRLDENERVLADSFLVLTPNGTVTQPDDFISLSAKVGYSTGKQYFDLWFDYQHTEGGNSYRDGDPSGFKSLGVSYSKIGGTYYYAFKPNFGAFLGLSKVFGGRNINDQLTISVGVVYKLNTNKSTE